MQIRKYFLGFIAATALLVACNDDEDMMQSRIFRPIEITVDNTGDGYVDFSWYPSKNASSYEVQISEDETFSEGKTNTYSDLKETTLHVTDGVAINSTDLDSLYVRIRAFSALQGVGDSEWLEAMKFAPYRENIFSTSNNTFKKEYVNNTSVIVRWKEGITDVDQLILRNADGSIKDEHRLTPEEIDARSYTFEGLTPSTVYSVSIYNEGKRRGKVVFTTRSANEVIVTGVDELLAQLKAVEPGWVIRVKALSEGAPYEFSSALNITKSVTIESASDAPTQFYLPDGVNLRGTLGKVSFNDLIITGDGASGENTFNLAKAGNDAESVAFASIDSLVISGCEISNYNKALICYGPDDTSCNVFIDNSIVHDISAGKSAQVIDLRNVTVTNMKITNSTFYNMERAFIRVAKNENSQNFELSNCTFYNTNASSQSFIDFNNGSKGTYLITNNIFSNITGKGWTMPQDKDADGKATPASSSTLEYSYNCIFNVNFTSNATAQWHVEEGNRLNTNPMFAAPETGDFTLSSSSPCLSGGKRGSIMGDPRWKK